MTNIIARPSDYYLNVVDSAPFRFEVLAAKEDLKVCGKILFM
jgi:hypothetical protein